MERLRTFLKSPLAQHPGLFLRKVASRLGLYREDEPVPNPPVLHLLYPDHWAVLLREWLAGISLNSGPHSFGRLFGQDFDESVLLRLCRTGPAKDTVGLLADVKLIWDYSRGHALFTNAALGPEYTRTSVDFLRRWLQANENTNGINWTCAMDVAIRGTNWVFADALLGGRLSEEFGRAEWASWLWRHGWVIWRRLETKSISTNHYVADLLGLYVISSIFPDDSAAKAWRRFAETELPRTLVAQTHRDGGLDEASLRYHAFVTEMALLFRLASGRRFLPVAEARLCDMCQIVADFQDAAGDVFPIGDDDSGRVLAVDFVSASGRAKNLLSLARVVLRREFKASPMAVYADSGWCVRTIGDFRLALEFGGVGLCGVGAHAHNDDFSFCLDWNGQPVIVDPGTCIYTGDPGARNRFRSTLAHNTVVCDDREQRPLNSTLFQLRGRTESHAFRAAGERWTFERSLAPNARHHREITPADSAIFIRDSIRAQSRHQLEWRFTLHPDIHATRVADGFALSLPNGGTLDLKMEPPVKGVDLQVVPAEFSQRYGHHSPTQRCLARLSAQDCEIRWRICAPA